MKTAFKINMQEGRLEHYGENLEKQKLITADRKVKDILSIFKNPSISEDQKENLAYHVEVMMPREEGVENHLQFGFSHIMKGDINGEYMMTKGHFHEKREAPEIYWGVKGKGLLILMNEEGKTWFENVEKGTLHHISGHIAHRLVNIGDETLVVGTCWPLDAGHDYGSINDTGFGLRIFKSKNGFEIKEG